MSEKLTASCVSFEIDDLDQRADAKGYSKIERQLRCQLASAYRLVDYYGWSEGIYNHISCRLPGVEDRFLMNPFGLLFNEITASSLITIDLQGHVLDKGSTRLSLNPRGFTLHSALYEARPDVHSIFHLHTPEVISISCTKEGFVPVCQEGCFIGPVSHMDFHGTLTELDKRKTMAECLGDNNVMLLRNHGFVTSGTSVPDAMFKAYFFIYNIRAQINLIKTKNLILLSDEAAKRTYEALRHGEISGNYEDFMSLGQKSNAEIHWPTGQLDWEANMRLLDNMGMKTGHQYRLNVWRDHKEATNIL